MKLVVISDLHDSVAHVDALRDVCVGARALIVCGDFTTFGDHARIQKMADDIRVEGVPCYFVTGNCDAMPVGAELQDCHNLHGCVLPLGGWLLAGMGGALPCPGRTPNEYSEAEGAAYLREIRVSCGGDGERLILVSHQPPFGTSADLLPDGRHVGSHALRAFIDEVHPAYCLTGHIHEAASRTHLGRTVVLNPGPFSKGNIAVIDVSVGTVACPNATGETCSGRA